MATITPADLSTTVYKFGGYWEAADSTNPVTCHSGIGGPIVPKSSRGKYHEGSDEDKHFVQDFNPFSFSLVEEKKLHPEDVPAYKLKMLPAGLTDTHKIVYLPFHQKNITSTIIRPDDESVCYFITDGLSGCNMYIDQLEDGNLVCYHANAMHKRDKAQAAMDEMHSTAQETGAENKASLRMANYYAKAQDLEEQKVKGQTDRKFCGGTTIMGFRVAGRWEFWFQTYGRLTYTIKDTGIAGFVKGKGKEFKQEQVPLTIIDSGRFWP